VVLGDEMNQQGLAKRVILAILLLTGMCVHVAFLFMPPIWTIPASGFVGLTYYLVRISVEILRHSDIEQGVLLFGFEAIIATVVAYGLFVGLIVLLP
jgi:hypothetical protein